MCENRVDPVNSPRPFFKRGVYTESDNAPARKIGSGYGETTTLYLQLRQPEEIYYDYTVPAQKNENISRKNKEKLIYLNRDLTLGSYGT